MTKLTKKSNQIDLRTLNNAQDIPHKLNKMNKEMTTKQSSNLLDLNDKTWFRAKLGQILTSPCEVKFANFEKRHYWLVPRVMLLHCANFCLHRNCLIQTTSQSIISGQNWVKFWLCVRSNVQVLTKVSLRARWHSCFPVPIFVYIGLAWSKREVKSWNLTSPCEIKLANLKNKPLWACSQIKVALLSEYNSRIPSYSKTDCIEQNLVKIGQILTFDLYMQGQFWEFSTKKNITGLFLVSSCLVVQFLSKSEWHIPSYSKKNSDFLFFLWQSSSYSSCVWTVGAKKSITNNSP